MIKIISQILIVKLFSKLARKNKNKNKKNKKTQRTVNKVPWRSSNMLQWVVEQCDHPFIESLMIFKPSEVVRS